MLGPVDQPDYLDGELIHVDGAAIHLRENGITYQCTTNEPLAAKLAAYLHKQPVRLFGRASWIRHEATGWQLQRFVVEDFVPLEDTPLGQALSELEELRSEENRRG
jgi:hypothetical protein